MTLRVLHATGSLSPDGGSVAVSLGGLINALQAHGIESRTVGFGEDEAGTRIAGEGISLVGEVDIVHLHGWSGPNSRRLARAAKRASKPFIISPHGNLLATKHNKRNWRARLGSLLTERRLIRRAAAVTALNEIEERQLQSRRFHPRILQLLYGLDVNEYALDTSVDDGSAHNTIADDHLPRAAHVLLVLGPIHPIEGFVPLLKAFAEIGADSDGWGIVLAGRETGEWRKVLEAAVRRKGEEGRVVIVAAPDVATQRAWLSRATALAAPSQLVRFPVSVLQAVAAGVPVLASGNVAPTGLEDVIRVCGTSRDDLKAGLRWLLTLEDAERAKLGQRARRIAQARFDWPVLAKQYVQLYESLS